MRPEPPPDRIERAGTATICELHADAEYKGADHQRGPKRRDGSAILRGQCSNRHDGQRAYCDHDQAAEQATGLAARQKSPPGRGETEFSLEKRDAESEAAEDQRGRRRLLIEQHKRDQDGGRAERKPEEKAVDTNGRARIGRGQTHARHGNSWKLRADQDPRPRAFFRSSHFVREDSTGRLALLVHSTIEPA